ncbi:unnamed protein product, partial [marine sediment metagenome]
MFIAAMRVLCRHFSSDSSFWGYFDKYFYEHMHALALERQNHYQTLSAYSLDEMKTIAAGKSALGKCAIAGLAVLTDTEDR